MPEIVEIDLISKDLDRAVRAATVEKVYQAQWYLDKRVAKKPEADLSGLIGWRFSGVVRVGKALVFKMENPGIGNRYIASRLGMSGRWSLKSGHNREPEKRNWVVNLWLKMDGGSFSLVYSDTRKFGTIEVRDNWDKLESIKIYGPEITSQAFSIDWVKFCCGRHSVPIKELLLRQEYFGGVGNWIANEVLFKAHIHPLKESKKLSQEEIRRLFTSIHLTIQGAIASGGATLDSWQRPGGEKGRAQDEMYVYDRKGKLCRLCNNIIRKIKVGARGTYFCGDCQPVEEWKDPEPVSEDYVKEVVERTRHLM